MRLPLPRNRLVQLTLVGAVLTTAIAAGLLVPGAFGDHSTPAGDGSDETTLGPDAPTPNDRFTPATSGGDDDDGEHEEYEGDEHGDEEEDADDEADEHYGTLNAPGASAGESP